MRFFAGLVAWLQGNYSERATPPRFASHCSGVHDRSPAHADIKLGPGRTSWLIARAVTLQYR